MVSTELATFLKDLGNVEISNLSEDATKNAIILRLLAALGWNIFDPDEVSPEFVVGNKRVDYCLRVSGENKVFIECKKANEPLELHQEQLLNYAFHEGIELAILTNGVDWWFYLPMSPGSWEQRKVLALQLLEQEEQELQSRLTNLLSNEQVRTNKALQAAKDLYASNKRDEKILSSLPAAWSQLIDNQDDRLIELVNAVNENICGFRATDAQVAEFIAGVAQGALVRKAGKSTPAATKNQTSRLNVPSGAIESFTGTKPSLVQIGDSEFRVDSWIGVLETVCGYLQTRHPLDFAEKALSLRGTKRPHFSRNGDELRIPMQLEGSQIYVEANFSANSIFRLANRLLILFEERGPFRVLTINEQV